MAAINTLKSPATFSVILVKPLPSGFWYCVNLIKTVEELSVDFTPFRMYEVLGVNLLFTLGTANTNSLSA